MSLHAVGRNTQGEDDPMKKTTALVAAAGLAIAGAAHADSEWTAPVSGSYTLALNWTPANVPDTASETAVIGLGPVPFTVTLSGAGAVTAEGLVITNPAAVFDIAGSDSFIVAGGVFSNDGLVRINSNNSSADAVLSFASNTTITGGGTIRLNRNIDARLETGPGIVVTNTARIEGVGHINAAIANSGVIEAVSGGTLELRTNDKSNTGTLGASGAFLDINSIAIANAGGTIHAGDAGTVRAFGPVRIEGGTLSAGGSGQFSVQSSGDLTLEAVTSGAPINVVGGGDVFVEGGLTSTGDLVINTNASSGDARLVFVDDGTLAGAGVTRLGRNIDARLETESGATVTVAAAHTITGGGVIAASLVNNGLIDAETAGGVLEFSTNDKVNNGLMRARNNGTLNIATVATTQSPTGVLRADGGLLRISGGATRVEGGSIEVVNGGAARAESSADLALAGVRLQGRFDMNGGSTVVLSSGLTNDGTIVIDDNNSSADALLTTDGDVAVSGNGTIRLNRNIDAVLSTGPAATLTLGANQTLAGRGVVAAHLVNNGLVDSDVAGAVLDFTTENKVNNGLMRASNGGTLDIAPVHITQSPPGVMRADGGVILVAGGAARVENGTIETLNGGVLRVISSGALTLDSLDFSGQADVESGATVVVDSALTNDGTILLNSNNSSADATLSTVADASIDGTGVIRMGRNLDTVINTAGGATLTMGAGQSIVGGGIINAAIVNNGVIDADTVGGSIDLRVEPKINNNSMRASAGILDISAVTILQAPGADITADGGTVRAGSGAVRIEGGTLATVGASTVEVVGGATLTLEDATATGRINLLGGGTLAAEQGVTIDALVVVDSNNSTADATLRVADGRTINGNGVVRLDRAIDAVLATPGTATFGGQLRLEGTGNVNGSWNFRGTLAPGLSVGTIANSGTINLQPAADFELELASTASFDRLNGGAVNVGGTLAVSFDGYAPVKNDAFRFINASVTGTFDQVVGPPLPDGLVYGVKYDPAFVELRIVCGPDLNLDGLLDFFDVQVFLEAFSAGDPLGDYNEDGLFDFFDVLAFLDAFSASCP
jgi:hypothetical protein